MSLDCVIYCAFYSILFRGAVFSRTRCINQTAVCDSHNSLKSVRLKSNFVEYLTRSQAVVRIADRTASQHLRGSRDVIGDVTIWYHNYAISYWWSFGTKPLSLTVSEIFNVECRPQRNGWRGLDTTSKQRSTSFILVPIDFSHTTFYRLSIVTFALGRTV